MNKASKIDFSVSADYVINLGIKIEKQEKEIEVLKHINNVLIKHIEILDRRNRKFSDKFKFGRFRFKTLKEELDSKKIAKQSERVCFNLNDD